MFRSRLAAIAAASLAFVSVALCGGPASADVPPKLVDPSVIKLAGNLPPLAAVPAVLSVADLRHIGRSDVIVADYGATATISVFLNNADGTFAPAKRYTTGIQADYVGVGDFNHDGILDLAVTNMTSSTVSVLMGKGDGTFKPAVDYPTGIGPGALALGDFRHTGNLDMVISNQEPTLSVLRGNPDGTFQPAQSVSAEGGLGSGSADAADVYGDGNLSFLRGNYVNDTVQVYRGNRDGSFRPPVYYSTGALTPWYGRFQDLRHNGKQDIIFSSLGSSAISVLLNNGDGTYGQPRTYPTGLLPQCFEFADLRHIGRTDIVQANLGSNTITVYLGNGDGTFTRGVDVPVGALPFSVGLADFFHDGKISAVVANGGDGTISVLHGNGDGTFTPVTTHPA
ncbi:VCBS repeat-containing protein [Nocardia sp. NEAU-G5]|uniref:VCBS repeat-containing protein n=1 Tax=Nocardia albiluteola TaxID=2842303 RepID=A0ABS6AWE1_9NOCA|nr:VCBS repeat-containing protein [Nocardia albiluteola]MBU3062361.1 VCBS repeat-containing protein [Nocardia albiluteola]